MAYGTVKTDLITNSNGLTGKGFGPGFVNRIINGDMRIDQRNAGAAVTVNTSATTVYPVDRFGGVGVLSAGVFTLQQDASAPVGFINSIKAVVTTADTSLATTSTYRIVQKIEGTNIADLAWGSASAKTITLSFWVQSSLTGTFGGALRNSGNTRSYPFTYTISSANTWEQKTITIAGDTTGTWLTTTGLGVEIAWALGAGTDRSGTAGAWAGANCVSATGATSVIGTLNATWYITGVQLEVGGTATSFDYRPYGTELTLCQRYYEKATFDVRTIATGANSFVVTMYSVPKRTTSYTPAFTAAAAATNNISGTPTIQVIGDNQIRLNYSSTSSGDTYYVRTFDMPAEL